MKVGPHHVISVFVSRERPKLPLSAMWGHIEEVAVSKAEESPQWGSESAGTLSWTSQFLELWEINSSCLSQPVYILLQQPKQAKIPELP